MTNFSTENVCAYIGVPGSLDHSDVVNYLRTYLYIENPNEDWNDIGEGKVSFSVTSVPCADLDIARIEGHVSVSAGFCSLVEDKSCVRAQGEKFNSLTGHSEFQRFKVIFHPSHLENVNFRAHVINHEFGHVLGLQDGDGTCPVSVMHNDFYGCSGQDLPFPSAADRASVESLIPGGGGGGGKGFGFF